jgi:L-alanine-DL-glutamate epimerase-like enolase superfamily enzyme
MANQRRKFLKNSLLLTGAILIAPKVIGIKEKRSHANHNTGAAKLKLSFKPYTLELKHVFTVASNSRTTTPVMLTEIEFDGMVGYGEASMPPYLGESQETVSQFLAKVNLSKFSDPFGLDDILQYIDAIDSNNTAAKASVDIALHDLVGKLLGNPWYRIWGYDPLKTPNTSFTIGIDTPEVVKQKTIEALPYKILKVKLGKGNDKEMIESVRTITDKPLYVDINQGWKDRQYALDMSYWLKEKGVLFIEQPMPKESVDDNAWLTAHSPLPIIADEAIQRLADLVRMRGAYSGVNIKLMKCTGMREAHKMLEFARAFAMKVMIGCMTETSCAVSAAAHLSPVADFADLDGPLLIKNDVFEGIKIIDGKVTLFDRPGIGVVKINP